MLRGISISSDSASPSSLRWSGGILGLSETEWEDSDCIHPVV